MLTLASTCTRQTGHAGSAGAGGDHRLSLSIVATTDAGTRAALAAARALGRSLDPSVVVFVPHIVPLQEPLDPLAYRVAFTRSRVIRLVKEAGTDAMVQVCVCRPDASGLDQVLPPGDAVLIGGRRGRWWPGREQRLACRLVKEGFRVLFVDTCGSTTTRAATT